MSDRNAFGVSGSRAVRRNPHPLPSKKGGEGNGETSETVGIISSECERGKKTNGKMKMSSPHRPRSKLKTADAPRCSRAVCAVPGRRDAGAGVAAAMTSKRGRRRDAMRRRDGAVDLVNEPDCVRGLHYFLLIPAHVTAVLPTFKIIVFLISRTAPARLSE